MVSAYLYAEGGGDSKALRSACREGFRKLLEREYNVLLQGGQGSLKGKIFRIGHMGFADWPDLLVTFAAMERILTKAGRAPARGSALSAIVDRMP